MCPYTLDHNKMLASTMQHSTHNHTPTHHNHHHTHPHTIFRVSRDALDGPGQEQPRKNTHRVSSQDPTVCELIAGEPASDWQPYVFHPATPTPRPAQHQPRCLIRYGISERRPRRAHHQRRWLLRKEVIQPHLPVRLPCYDFVPIASPTFDDSPPQVG